MMVNLFSDSEVRAARIWRWRFTDHRLGWNPFTWQNYLFCDGRGIFEEMRQHIRNMVRLNYAVVIAVKKLDINYHQVA
jgi:hypothetical protein